MSPNERIGFPDEYRAGREQAIWRDIADKLPSLEATGKVVVDIGPGCAPLAHLIVEMCHQRGHSLTLVDSPEMLAQLPDKPSVRKVDGYFPRECGELLDELRGRVDVVLTYSVFQYVFNEYPWQDFLESALQLLAPGGQMLIGDIPNISKRKRFFASETGIKFHRAFTQTDGTPEVHFNQLEPGQMDDAIVLAIVQRCRSAGFDAYVIPQADDLPMANRREDVLIRRP